MNTALIKFITDIKYASKAPETFRRMMVAHALDQVDKAVLVDYFTSNNKKLKRHVNVATLRKYVLRWSKECKKKDELVPYVSKLALRGGGLGTIKQLAIAHFTSGRPLEDIVNEWNQ